MGSSARYVIELSVRDRHGFDTWRMCLDSDELPIFSERLVDDIRDPGPVPHYGFDAVVKILKERKFRRELLLAAAQRLAERLADYIEDAEGWHGERRRETIKQNKRR